MKKIVPFLLMAALTTCGQSEAPRKATDSAASTPTVAELAANPERPKELRQQCKTERPGLGEVLCNRVAEATSKRQSAANDIGCPPGGRYRVSSDLIAHIPFKALIADKGYGANALVKAVGK